MQKADAASTRSKRCLGRRRPTPSARRRCMPDAVPASRQKPHEKYDRLIAAAKSRPPILTAVAHPCDAASLGAAAAAARLGLIVPVLVAPPAKLREVADREGIDLGTFEIVEAAHSHEAAAKAVELVQCGRAEALMKGSLHTDELMGAVVAREAGIRTARRISHCFVMDVPGHRDALII